MSAVRGAPGIERRPEAPSPTRFARSWALGAHPDGLRRFNGSVKAFRGLVRGERFPCEAIQEEPRCRGELAEVHLRAGIKAAKPAADSSIYTDVYTMVV